MAIKWSASRVSEAMDKTEELVNQIKEPLIKAREAITQARTIPGIPQYLDQYLMRLLGEIDRTIGEGTDWNPEGQLKALIDLVRLCIPAGAIEAEKKQLEHGDQGGMSL